MRIETRIKEQLNTAAFIWGVVERNAPLADYLHYVCNEDSDLCMGGLEIIAELTCWAEPLAEILLALWDSDVDFCGVYHYQVSEGFGTWWARYVSSNKKLPSNELCWIEIFRQVNAFLKPEKLSDAETVLVRNLLSNIRSQHRDT